MRWKGRRQSTNVEDRRGMSPGKGVLGGGMGLLIVIGLVMCMGGDPTPLIQQIDIGAIGGGSGAPPTPKQEEQAQFIAVVLAALSLTLTFASIEGLVAGGAPRHMEWYMAYSLMVTLIWLYIELLRLLALLARNR